MADRRVLVTLAGGTLILAVLGASPAATAAPPRFTKPVRLTTGPVGGFEPGVVVDEFGNVFVSANKSVHGLGAGADPGSATGVRANSWVWWSKNDGRTFERMPGSTALDEQNAVFGMEGDLAVDDTGHVYFVDTSVAEVSVTRWRASGRGELALEHVRPAGPSRGLDDRPWLAAHGDGVVLYLGNALERIGNPAGQPPSGGSDGSGYGRFLAYMSYDHGETFDPIGVSLRDSAMCTPFADRRAGSRTFYVVCTDRAHRHLAFVTHDDGRTWVRYVMGGFERYHIASWLNGAVAPDGTVYVSYHDGSDTGMQGSLYLYASKDRGRTWTKRDVTGATGNYAYSWMSVAPDGTIGIAYYYSPDGRKGDWNVWAGVAKPGRRFRFAKVAPGLPITGNDGSVPVGDFFKIAFGPDSALHVVWTSNVSSTPDPWDCNVYYARQVM